MDRVINIVLYLWTNWGGEILTATSAIIIRYLEKMKMRHDFERKLKGGDMK